MTPEPIQEPATYTRHNGEEVEIPVGATIVRNGDTIRTMFGEERVWSDEAPEGAILFWHNPADPDMGKDQLADYEPHFDRLGGARRLLGHITDEVDDHRVGPRNTIPALALDLATEPSSTQFPHPSTTALRLNGVNVELPEGTRTTEQQVEELLERLIAAGLVERRDGGTYAVTDAGWIELRN